MEFVLCKKGGTIKEKEVAKWVGETVEITLLEGLGLPKIYYSKIDNATALLYECTDEQFEPFITKNNLVVDQIVRGIRFLKSS